MAAVVVSLGCGVLAPEAEPDRDARAARISLIDLDVVRVGEFLFVVVRLVEDGGIDSLAVG